MYAFVFIENFIISKLGLKSVRIVLSWNYDINNNLMLSRIPIVICII